MDSLTTQQVRFGRRTLELLGPGDPAELLDAAAQDGGPPPYWSDVWPCAGRLAAWLDSQELAGKRVLELGCGLGLPSLVAALAGAEVVATDIEPEALLYVQASAKLHRTSLQTMPADYRALPPALLAAGPYDLVLAADVLYRADCTAALARLAPLAVAAGGALVVAVSWENQEAGLASLLRDQGFTVSVEGPRPWLLRAARSGT